MVKFPSLSPINTHSRELFLTSSRRRGFVEAGCAVLLPFKTGESESEIRALQTASPSPFFIHTHNISLEKVGRECSWIPNKLRGRKIFPGERAWLNSCRHARAPGDGKVFEPPPQTEFKKKESFIWWTWGGDIIKMIKNWSGSQIKF